MSAIPSISQPACKRLGDKAILGILILVALVNGLVYTFLMPPWQHYDEPGHFEVVWLAAHLKRLPQPGDYDPKMSRAVLISMIQNRFYGDPNAPLPAEDAQVQVPGYRQLDEPPGYYLLASLPVRAAELAGVEDVADQLRAARLASLLLFLCTVFCAWGIARELTPEGHVVRWMAPLSLALLPGFVDLMTAVNNDVGAVAIFSFFLWGAVRLIQHRFSLLNLLWVLAAVVVGYFTKVTVLVALVLLPVVLLLALLRGRLRWIAWAAVGVAGFGVLLAALTWGDSAWWARSTFQAGNTQLATAQAPLGARAFQIEIQPGARPQESQLIQLLALPKGESLKGKQITLGAWMWASRPVKATSPSFNTFSALKTTNQPVELDEKPRFVAFTAQVEGDASRNFVSLAPFAGPVDEPVTVFVDGVTLAEGSWPLDQAPVFDGVDGRKGTWGGLPFANLLRNPSAEARWLRLRPWVDAAGVRILPDEGANQPSVSLYYMLDTAAAWPFQRLSAQVLFRTWWARFGWGHIPLMQPWAYWIISAAMLAGLFAAILAMLRLRVRFPWSAALLLGLALLGVWLQTFLRGANYPTQLRAIYYPTARYAYPVIIPSLLLLNLGWYEIGRSLKIHLHLPGRALSASYVLAWLAFNLYAILSIARYYRVS